jgi:hypothetical protein
MAHDLDGLGGKATLGISAFAEVGVGASMTLLGRKLYVRAAPTVYFPLIYARQGAIKFATDSNIDDLDTTTNPLEIMNINAHAIGEADFAVWTPFSLDNVSVADMFGSPGVDLSIEGRYAIWRILEAGLSVSHIPIAPAKTKYVTKATGELDMTAGINGVEDLAGEDSIKVEGSKSELNTIVRPVRFDFFAIVKPFNSLFFYVKPNIGFTLLNIVDSGSPNFGLEVGVNLPIILSASIGTHLTDGMWEHALRMAIDLRVFELDLLAGLSGPAFLTNGVTVGVGIKTGF